MFALVDDTWIWSNRTAGVLLDAAGTLTFEAVFDIIFSTLVFSDGRDDVFVASFVFFSQFDEWETFEFALFLFD